MQEHEVPDDDDATESEPPNGGEADGRTELSEQSPDAQLAASHGRLGLQVQWRWSQEGHPEQGVTCMAWSQVKP